MFYDGWIDVSPTIMNITNYLRIKNYEIDFFIDISKGYQHQFINDTKGVHWIEINSNDNRIIAILLKIKKSLNYINNKTNSNVFKYLKFFEKIQIVQLNYFSRNVKKHVHSKTYDSLIVVDQTGLYVNYYAKISSIKKYYLSLEILDLKNVRSTIYLNKLKQIEILNLTREKFNIIIQDKWRLNIFKESLGYIDLFCVFYLANTSSRENKILNYNYFKEIFKLENEKKIVLVAGMMNSRVLTYDLIDYFSGLRDLDYIVVLHDRLKNNSLNSKIERKNIKISDTPFDYKFLETTFANCDIGLVFYNPLEKDRNFSVIGHASGKFFNYIKFGKPVISFNNLGLSELIKTSHCGIVIEDIDSLNAAITKIMDNYNYYSDNASKLFWNNFVFEDIIEVVNF